MKIKVAFATDDGQAFVNRHFGDAAFYDVYEITKTETKLLERIENITEEERQHADPVKAKNITELLKKKGVMVVVSKVFGPNIERIKLQFVCIRVNDEVIAESIKTIQNRIDIIYYEKLLGEKRNILDFRNKNLTNENLS